MKRLVDEYLVQWAQKPDIKPLIIHGARQVGKTYAVRDLGKQFDTFIELNCEFDERVQEIFLRDFDVQRIVREIAILTDKVITPKKTLLFFDEIQVQPRAILALRYFHELMPDLHVIAAGSLLDFAIEQVGMPVGRVQSIHMYPMSFVEFLWALNKTVLLDELAKQDPNNVISPIIHDIALELVSTYMAVGGMPEAVKKWVDTQDFAQCSLVHQSLVDTYRRDFIKYAKRTQLERLSSVFDSIPAQVSTKFKYSSIEGDYRKRELAPCLDLLVTAGIVYKVFHSDAQGLPLGAGVDLSEFKVIFLDVALTQVLLGLELGHWFSASRDKFINNGAWTESFVGQELLAYASPFIKKQLYYWHRTERNSQAEVDYVVQLGEAIIPIEVKSGSGSTLKSMHMFLDTHKKSAFGIRFSAQNYSVHEKIYSYPLYAIFNALVNSR